MHDKTVWFGKKQPDFLEKTGCELPTECFLYMWKLFCR